MVNLLRGFRRIGWVTTVPTAAFLILVFLDNTREFSASQYEAERIYGSEDTGKYRVDTDKGSYIVETENRTPIIEIPAVPGIMPNIGYAAFQPRDVPEDVAARVIADFTKSKPNLMSHNSLSALKDRGWEQSKMERQFPSAGNLRFTRKSTNPASRD